MARLKNQKIREEMDNRIAGAKSYEAVCENCAADGEDVQLRECGHELCENCMPCPLHSEE